MLQKTNLYSLLKVNEKGDNVLLGEYLKFHEIAIKPLELNDLMLFTKAILAPRKATYRAFDYFAYGFNIPQIGKEFDLLRFGTKSIINIELKSTSTLDEIKNQLVKNKYYLKFLNLKLYLFTYISSENKFYQLSDSDDLIEVAVTKIILILNKQFVNIDVKISSLFNPSDFLVSPFNSTNKFINKEYFLTQEQDQYKREILKNIENGEKFIVLKGQPGSGKTLLLYDIAKRVMQTKNTSIIHCANLNSGQDELNDNYDWNIFPAKMYKSAIKGNIEVIFIDECQRIWLDQLQELVQYAKNTSAIIIFSYDERQVLTSSEKQKNIPLYIESNLSPKIYTLKAKIRTNKEITAFIKSLFEKDRLIEQYSYDSIELLYLQNMDEAKSFIGSDIAGDWTIINYTPSRYNTYQYEKYHVYEKGTTTHSIIGQEFDKVVVVIDEDFKYKNSLLTYTKRCHYDPEFMLYQNITRARNKIKVIVINNIEVLARCLQILNVQKK